MANRYLGKTRGARMSLRLPEPLHKKVAAEARKRKKSKTELVLDAVKKELGYVEPPPTNSLFD